MNNNIKFPVNRYYIFASLILPIAVFLFTTCFLLFGKPTTKDLPPVISLDVLYLLLTVWGLKKYFILAGNKLTALELNEKEIIDHIFNVRVNWDNVTDIRFIKYGHSGYISVSVKDKKAVIAQTKNIFEKLVFYLNILFTGTPVKIQTAYTKGRNSNIFDKVYAYFKDINFEGNIDP